jgi:two-component system nitrogen regulation sensor histidine kinase NtrY
MNLSRFRIFIVIQALLLVLTSFLFLLVLENKNYPVTSIDLGVIWLLQLIGLIYYLNRVNRDLERFFNTFAYEDGMMVFDTNKSDKVFRKLHEQMNKILLQLSDIRIGKEQQHLLYKNALRESSTGLCIYNSKLEVIEVNDAFLRLFHFNSCKHLNMLRKLDENLPSRILALKPLKKELIEFRFEQQLTRLSVNTNLLRIAGNDCFILSVDDVKTEMDLAEIEAWKKMTRVITHEIMNSVSPISLMTTGLLEIYNSPAEVSKNTPLQLKEQTINSLEVIRKRSRHLTKFIESYRNMAKLPVPVKERVSVTHLFDQLDILFSGEVRNLNAQLSFYDSENEYYIEADEKMIEQVLINLIRNALDATEGIANPVIIVSAGRIEQNISISISDNGKGINDEIASLVFVPFFTTRENGSGIGLYLARQIMIQHGGSISFVSKKGEGTTFKIEFPDLCNI